jgi:hypothetical protein
MQKKFQKLITILMKNLKMMKKVLKKNQEQQVIQGMENNDEHSKINLTVLINSKVIMIFKKKIILILSLILLKTIKSLEKYLEQDNNIKTKNKMKGKKKL